MKTYKMYGNNFKDLFVWLLYTHVFTKIPYRLLEKPKRLILKILLKKFGKNSFITNDVRLIYPQGIEIEDNVGIAHHATLDGRGGLEIGQNTIIGFESIILTCTHRSDNVDIPILQQGLFTAPVKIGRNVWLGARVIIMPGITIGNNAIIGANSVVTKNVPDRTIWGGVPANFIRNR